MPRTLSDDLKETNSILKKILKSQEDLNKMIKSHLGHKKEIPQPYFFWLEVAIMGLLITWFTLDMSERLID